AAAPTKRAAISGERMSQTVANEVTISATPMCMPRMMKTSMPPMARKPSIRSLMLRSLCGGGGGGTLAPVLPGQQRVLHRGQCCAGEDHDAHGPGGEGEHAFDAEELVVRPRALEQRPGGVGDHR